MNIDAYTLKPCKKTIFKQWPFRRIKLFGYAFEWIFWHDYYDDPFDTLCLMYNLLEKAYTVGLDPWDLAAFEGEVLQAWQQFPSAFHFFESSKTLGSMFGMTTAGNLSTSCNVSRELTTMIETRTFCASWELEYKSQYFEQIVVDWLQKVIFHLYLPESDFYKFFFDTPIQRHQYGWPEGTYVLNTMADQQKME